MSEENANTTVEMVEDILDAVVEPEKANILVPAVIAVAAFSLGGFLGYTLAKRNLEKKYDQMLEEETERTVDYLKTVMKEEIKREAAPRQQTRVNPKKSLEELKAELGYDDVINEDKPSVLINGRKLADSIIQETVDTSGPHIISEDEFNENADDYEQLSLSYYTEDDILADEADEAVEAVDSVVGSENLKSFGRNSRDPNVIFVKNDEAQTLFEIVQIRGSYVKLVLGFDEDDSGSERLRKFRIDE